MTSPTKTQRLSVPLVATPFAIRFDARATSRVARTAATLTLAALLGACATPPSARTVPPANETLPEALRAGPHEVLQDVLSAVGQSVYTCRRAGDAATWVRTGTEATLIDPARRTVGTVAPGPRFIAFDGSTLLGTVVAEQIVAADALPWQRLTVRVEEHSLNDDGRFEHVASVQRVRTRGGLPPDTQCTQLGMSLLVPYEASYLFYRTSDPRREAMQPQANVPTPASAASAPATP